MYESIKYNEGTRTSKIMIHVTRVVPAPDGISFPLLRANDLRSSLLNIRARIFYSLVRRGTYAMLVYNWYRNIFHAFAVLIVSHAANEKTGRRQD